MDRRAVLPRLLHDAVHWFLIQFMTTAPMKASPAAASDDYGFVLDQPRPKWSIAAIVGFVLSFMFILAPVGMVLGIVGIFRTRGGRRRGMGLAVASIPIGAVMGSISIVMLILVVMVVGMRSLGGEATAFMKAGAASVPTHAAELYDTCSKRFRVVVTQEEFTSWAKQVVARFGTLQNVDWSGTWYQPNKASGGADIRVTGQFVNGPRDITIAVGFDGFKPEIDDIAVDGQSPKSRTN